MEAPSETAAEEARKALEQDGPKAQTENDTSGDAKASPKPKPSAKAAASSESNGGTSSEADDSKPGQQLTFGVGGKKPTASTVRLVGGKIEDGGEYKKGDVVRLEIEAVVSEVAFVDKFDSETGQVVATERRHKLKIHGHEVLED